ncbi:uncharacterized protein ACOB8E_008719 [Sarcophilus harrisii]
MVCGAAWPQCLGPPRPAGASVVRFPLVVTPATTRSPLTSRAPRRRRGPPKSWRAPQLRVRLPHHRHAPLCPGLVGGGPHSSLSIPRPPLGPAPGWATEAYWLERPGAGHGQGLATGNPHGGETTALPGSLGPLPVLR